MDRNEAVKYIQENANRIQVQDTNGSRKFLSALSAAERQVAESQLVESAVRTGKVPPVVLLG